MFVYVDFTIGPSGTRWRVPATAMIFNAQGTRVAIVGAGNKLHFQDVVVGRDLGTSIDIQADIENIGMASAPASVFFVDASFGNPLTMMQQGASMQWTVNVPALAANTSQRVSVATVSVPNNMQDWDLVLVGTADPPTVAQPVRGLIIESDETNNVKNHACRWFGATPDTSLQACN